MVITIIALIISLFSLGLGLSVLIKKREAGRELDGIIEDIRRELDNPAPTEDGLSPGKEKEIVSYDRERNTIVVNGNIEAKGYISCGNKEE